MGKKSCNRKVTKSNRIRTFHLISFNFVHRMFFVVDLIEEVYSFGEVSKLIREGRNEE